MLDFNLARPGITANPLIQLIQEIETIMTANYLDIITFPTANANLEQYLFKTNVSTAMIASNVQRNLMNKLSNSAGYDIQVDCDYLMLKFQNDAILVSIHILENGNLQETLQYSITNTDISEFTTQ